MVAAVKTSGDERRRVVSVLGPSVIKQQLQYLSDDDDDAADFAQEPVKVIMPSYSFPYWFTFGYLAWTHFT